MKVPPDIRRDDEYLKDIIIFAERALSFIDGMTASEFDRDQKTLYAATHCLQIVGEASTHLTEEIRERIKEVPWRDIRGMRNILVHAYHNIDNEIIFLTLKNRLPKLILVIKKYFESLDENARS